MLDAYTRLSPLKGFDFTIGQMRPVHYRCPPFPSPAILCQPFIHSQASGQRARRGSHAGLQDRRSAAPHPASGNVQRFGLTDQKDFWTNNINYSAKAQWQLPKGFSVTLSAQKIRPEHISVNMYDGGITYQAGRWMIEAEYLYKHYTKDAFQDVNAFDGFICYDLPLKKSIQQNLIPRTLRLHGRP